MPGPRSSPVVVRVPRNPVRTGSIESILAAATTGRRFGGSQTPSDKHVNKQSAASTTTVAGVVGYGTLRAARTSYPSQLCALPTKTALSRVHTVQQFPINSVNDVNVSPAIEIKKHEFIGQTRDRVTCAWADNRESGVGRGEKYSWTMWYTMVTANRVLKLTDRLPESMPIRDSG